MRLGFLLILIFGVCQNALGLESLCPNHPQAVQEAQHNNYCNEYGDLVRVDRVFSDPTKLSKSTFYEDGKRVNVKIYNIDQVQTYEGDIEELSDGTYLKTSFSVNPFRAYIKKKQWLRDIEGEILPEELALWDYEENETKTDSKLVLYLEYREGTNIPLRKAFYDELETVKFWEEYLLDNPNATRTLDVRVTGFTKFDGNNEIIAEYRTEGPITFDELYRDKTWPEAKPLGVVVIDSGFETDHPDLFGHWYQNPVEIFDGIDNDGNGVVDDVYGVNQVQGAEAINSLRESFLFNDKRRPITSHGTHVASLAMKDVKEWSLAGFAGNFTNPKQLERVGLFMENHMARFANMSFSFETPGGMAPPRESFVALEELIMEQEDVLFFVAAGNSNSDLDEIPKYPAAWNYDNMVVVGALSSSDWVDRPNQSYATKADFSSYGDIATDIFAPGTDVMAAFLGFDYGALSGTSMATPKALNVVARVAESYPELEPQVLKAALLLGAYIPSLQSPLPCKSGGVVFEARMRRLLEKYSNGMDLKEAALLARLDSPALEGEALHSAYFSQLESFWSERGLLPFPQEL